MKEHSVLSHPADRKISLRFDRVSFSYGNFKVLENACFHIHQGEFIALVGPNGSGKTTVLKLLLGLEQPQAGKIDLFGAGSTLGERNRVGYVPQQSAYDPSFPISVWEAVKMGRLTSLSRKFGAGDRAAVEEAMVQAEISDLANRSYAALSGGQRRRVLVARALAAKPEILILDEPTANMDRESEERLFTTLGKLKGNTTVLIVTHDTGFVSALTDRVLCMGNRETGAEYGVVQHRTEAEEAGAPSLGTARIIHGESIPGDQCDPADRRSEDVE
ncbi:metal ABC transporter ATP-binding protein [Treponema primitia]|uniref:metal ABC transporter ATP-binding protein n=1 Tax=Treponema primitia TaxID=88058 RepID=UPI0002554CB9|nr:metal ABC transporter ATP-binding protein [Treponema primitia]